MSALQTIETRGQMLEIELKTFELEQRRAMALSKSAFFPDSLKDDVASAVIVYDLANRMNISVMEVAQSVYIIYGRPSFSTSFLVARLNQSGLIKGALRSIVSEDLQTCRCEAVDSATGETYVGMTVTMKMANAEGWVSKKGSKWQTMPELMLRKRAQSFFIKEFYPQTMFGTQSSEEMEDVEAVATQSAYTSPALQQAVQAKTKTTAKLTKAQLEAQNVAESVEIHDVDAEVLEEPKDEVTEVVLTPKQRVFNELKSRGIKPEEMREYLAYITLDADDERSVDTFLGDISGIETTLDLFFTQKEAEANV